MAYTEIEETANDSVVRLEYPNDYFSLIASSRATARGAEKARKEAIERAAAEARAKAARDASDLQSAREKVLQLEASPVELRPFKDSADEEARKLRETYNKELALRDARINELNTDLDSMTTSNSELNFNNSVLMTRISSLEHSITQMKEELSQVSVLEAALMKMREEAMDKDNKLAASASAISDLQISCEEARSSYVYAMRRYGGVGVESVL